MNKHPVLLTCAAALLLSSCIMRSNIGMNIREPGTVYTSVQLCPVDGNIYRTPQQKVQNQQFDNNPAYALLPEVTFRKTARPWFEAHSILFHTESKPYAIHPTGKIHAAQVGVRYDGGPESVTALVDAIPADAKAEIPKYLPDAEEISLDRGAVLSEVGWGRRLAAAPFDYLIDPVLTVGMYAGYSVGAVIVSPFAGVYYLVYSACDQKQEKTTSASE